MSSGWGRVGELVKRRRKELRMTQKAAGLLARVSDTTWGSVENGRAESYDDDTLIGVCEALGWTPDSIERVLAGGDPEVLTAGPTAGSGVPMAIIERIKALLDELAKYLGGAK